MKTFLSFFLLLTIGLAVSCGNTKKKGSQDNGSNELSDDSLLNLVEYRTFQYFWDGAEPNSGMARERINVDGGDAVRDGDAR